MENINALVNRAKENKTFRGFSQIFFSFLRNPTGLFSFIVLSIYVAIAVIGPYIAPFSPIKVDEPIRLMPPSWSHLFGTDGNGIDIFSEVLYAIRLDMEIAFISVSIGYAIGVLVGVYSGYRGKVSDNVIMRLMDILLAFPTIILAIAIAVAIGKQSFVTVIIAVVIVSIPGFARVARSSVLSTKNDLYVLAAVSLGASRLHILFKHVLPPAISPTIVLYALGLGNAIITAAALSFIGVGIPPNVPELGSMITNGLNFVVTGQWWVSVIPGIFITIIVIAFNMMGDTIREVTDVTLRR